MTLSTHSAVSWTKAALDDLRLQCRERMTFEDLVGILAVQLAQLEAEAEAARCELMSGRRSRKVVPLRRTPCHSRSGP